MKYTPSKLEGGNFEVLRQQVFTRWLSHDLRQAAVDFCRNLGLVPAYSEFSADHLTRYLFWKPPQGACVEVRSGRSKEKFEELDRANREKKLKLFALHITPGEMYSAIWISPDHFDAAKTFLAAHGISVAESKDA